MKVYAYTCQPVDYDWDVMIDFHDYVTSVEVGHFKSETPKEKLLEILCRGTSIAKYFEGDFAVSPKITFIPDNECRMQIVIMWKQGNNGSTFAVSDRPILSLEQIDVEKEVSE